MKNIHLTAGHFVTGVVLCSLAIVFTGWKVAQVNHPLINMPGDALHEDEFDLSSRAVVVPAKPQGKTQLLVREDSSVIDYTLFLDPEQDFPYAHYARFFLASKNGAAKRDFSGYQNISFDITCAPKNVLMFVVFSADDKITQGDDINAARVSAAAFSCGLQSSKVTVALDDLITPDWWLNDHGYDYGDTGYRRDKVMGFAWVTTFQSPLSAHSRVVISDVKISGFKWAYLYSAIALVCIFWIAILAWFIRRHQTGFALLISQMPGDSQGARTSLQADASPSSAVTPHESFGSNNQSGETVIGHSVTAPAQIGMVKRIALERTREKEKNAVMNFMRQEFFKPSLSLEMATSSLGLNRNKINDILREEVGVTFSAYLNQLRLTEAARLLTSGETNIADVAYSVGYNNVSYFNKLFKEEFGCAPGQFKNRGESWEAPKNANMPANNP